MCTHIHIYMCICAHPENSLFMKIQSLKSKKLSCNSKYKPHLYCTYVVDTVQKPSCDAYEYV